MSDVKLNLKGWGLVHAEVLWIEGPLYKIRFVPEDTLLADVRTEVFHVTEILNINDIFIDKNLSIKIQSILAKGAFLPPPAFVSV